MTQTSAEETLAQLVDTLEDLADLSAYEIAADVDAWKKQAMTLIRTHTDAMVAAAELAPFMGAKNAANALEIAKLEARLEEAKLPRHDGDNCQANDGYACDCQERRIAALERELDDARGEK